MVTQHYRAEIDCQLEHNSPQCLWIVVWADSVPIVPHVAFFDLRCHSTPFPKLLLQEILVSVEDALETRRTWKGLNFGGDGQILEYCSSTNHCYATPTMLPLWSMKRPDAAGGLWQIETALS
jgi:hypothetical protein